MSGSERREQIVSIARSAFAAKGYEATSIEEIAAAAGISKPVVYEHFGGKEGLYAVVVDREVRGLLDRVTGALGADHPKAKLEAAALALLGYIEDEPDGFRILVRDSPAMSATGTFASLIGDIATRVEHILGDEFKRRGFDTKLAPLYSHALVGMVALVGEWWLDEGKPRRAEVAQHLVNLAWNGLGNLDPKPVKTARREAKAARA
jgi:AcrR family transcriptional regulator